MSAVRLKRWAADHDLSYHGALRMFHAGQIEGAYQLPSGTILVDTSRVEPSQTPMRAALYARVSTRKQADHLAPQIERLERYALGRGYQIAMSKTEVASGLNENRSELRAILTSPNWDVLIVEYRDRLARFGSRWIEGWVESTGRSVEYVHAADGDEESLAEDLMTVLTVFSARMYGKRGATNRAVKAARTMNPDA